MMQVRILFAMAAVGQQVLTWRNTALFGLGSLRIHRRRAMRREVLGKLRAVVAAAEEMRRPLLAVTVFVHAGVRFRTKELCAIVG